jgi:NADH:ubiquinone oxidoreductase subunit 1 (chain H)
MDSFVSTYVWPAAIMIAQSLLLLVALLLFIAYVLLADRKIWAAVQMRRGPNVVGPWGLFQSFADLLKFVFKEPVIPAAPTRASSCSRRSSRSCWHSPPGRSCRSPTAG